MNKLRIMVSTTFGVEAIVKKELRKLNYNVERVKNGRIEFEGTAEDLARVNLHLRAAERVYLKLAEFTARDFDELYDQVNELEWQDLIPYKGKFPVTGKSSKSQLHNVPACQSIIKKSIVDKLQSKYGEGRLPETGETYPVNFMINKDRVIIALDASGTGLHKRGYRQEAGPAPIKETIAAAMIYLSKWNRDRILIDPFCGSGTILIEAALMARKIAPGLNRDFVSEDWAFLPENLYDEMRTEARDKIWTDAEPRMLAGYDQDQRSVKQAIYNSRRAGVEEMIHFQQQELADFSTNRKYGYIISNPPYGERMAEDEVRELYELMGNKFLPLDTWSFYILTAHSDFEKYFGKEASKRRKLYNGGLECQFYQYYGPWPPSDGSDY